MRNFTRATKAFFILVSVLGAITFAGTLQQIGEVRPEGDWKATIEAAGTKLALVLHIRKKDGALGATLDSPDQGAT